MDDNALQFDRTCHTLYTKPCKAQIQEKIALHYPQQERKSVGVEFVKILFVDFLN